MKHAGRDPRLLWHEKTKRWVMAVYDEFAGKRSIAFYTSPNLSLWHFTIRIEGFFECPDLFELPIGHSNETKWILSRATPNTWWASPTASPSGPTRPRSIKSVTATFTPPRPYSGTPDGRRIQIGSGPGITFSGSHSTRRISSSLPACTLQNAPDGPRFFATPIDELKSLRQTSGGFGETQVTPQQPLRYNAQAELSTWNLNSQARPTRRPL